MNYLCNYLHFCLSNSNFVSSREVVSCRNLVDTFLLLELKARACNVLNAAPGLNADIGSAVFMPEHEVVVTVELDGELSLTHLAL